MIDNVLERIERRLPDGDYRNIAGRGLRAQVREAGRFVAVVTVGTLVIYSLLAAVGVFGLGMAAPSSPVDEEQREGSLIGVHVSEGVGSSMEPTISEGDRAICLEADEPEEGDIVVIESEALGSSHDVRHRVIDLGEETVLTQGDNNSEPDERVPREAVLCTVVWHE